MTGVDIERAAATLQGNDLAFFRRVWQTPGELYRDRLKALRFAGLEHVLDAGFGFGQWIIPLSELNHRVTGIEYSGIRFNAVKELMGRQNPKINLFQGSVELLPFKDNSFDAIFSYSVVLCTDYRKTLAEFYRVLKPGGRLYFNTNGLGWYIYNLKSSHNDASDFSSSKMAINAIKASIRYFAEGVTTPGECIITPKSTIVRDLEAIGFRNTIVDAEGCINLDPMVTARPFFLGEYENEEGVFEVLTEKLSG